MQMSLLFDLYSFYLKNKKKGLVYQTIKYSFITKISIVQFILLTYNHWIKCFTMGHHRLSYN